MTTTNTNTTPTTPAAANPVVGLMIQAATDRREPLFKVSEENRIRAQKVESFVRAQDGIEQARQAQQKMSRGAFVEASNLQSNPVVAGTFRAGMMGGIRA